MASRIKCCAVCSDQSSAVMNFLPEWTVVAPPLWCLHSLMGFHLRRAFLETLQVEDYFHNLRKRSRRMLSMLTVAQNTGVTGFAWSVVISIVSQRGIRTDVHERLAEPKLIIDVRVKRCQSCGTGMANAVERCPLCGMPMCVALLTGSRQHEGELHSPASACRICTRSARWWVVVCWRCGRLLPFVNAPVPHLVLAVGGVAILLVVALLCLMYGPALVHISAI